MTGILPDDVLEEILVRLSVKHLMRLKCVCKHWYALIRDDYGFHKKHYHFQYSMCVAQHNNIPLFLDQDLSTQGQSIPTQFYLLSKHQGADVVSNITPYLDRDIPPAFADDPGHSNRFIECKGVVNGVICLHWRGISVEQYPLALWNPATRKFKGITRWPIVLDNKGARVVAAEFLRLGFDLQSNDFKILGLFNFASTDYSNRFNECILYSLKSNSWKMIDEAPNSLLYNLKGSEFDDAQLNNNVYYWLATDCGVEGSREVIVSFNFSTEVFKQFELPQAQGYPHGICISRDGGRCRHKLKIGKYKESLALFVSDGPFHKGCVKIEMWVVTKFRDDDYGVPLSWQLGFIVTLPQSFDCVLLSRIRVCGDLLLLILREGGYVDVGCLYDPSTSTFNFLEVPFDSNFSYVESLFSVF